MKRKEVAIVGYGRTPYSRARKGERQYSIDEYIAWAANLALERAGMSIKDFDGQGLAIAHAEGSHTVNWSAATAELLGIQPQILLRADQGGASGAALLVRASAMIAAGVVDRVLVLGADTPLTLPTVAPGIPLSPERTRGVFWDFEGPFGVMGASGKFAMTVNRYRYQYGLKDEHLGKIAVTSRYHASLNPQAIYRTPITMDEYLDSRVISSPFRLYDCVPIVNGGLAYIVASSATACSVTDKPVYVLGFGEANNYYHNSRTHPDVTYTGFVEAAPKSFEMAGVTHEQIGLFQPYDDYPFMSMLELEDCGFAKKGQGGHFIEDHDIRHDGDFPISVDGGQLSGGQPGGAIGGFMGIVEAATQLRQEGGERQVPNLSVAMALGFGGLSYGRTGRSCISIILGL